MKHDRDLFILSIFTFITVAIWIYADLIKTSKKSTISQDTIKMLTPLPTNIRTDALEILNQRQNY